MKGVRPEIEDPNRSADLFKCVSSILRIRMVIKLKVLGQVERVLFHDGHHLLLALSLPA